MSNVKAAWKALHLEDTNENVAGYDNHIKLSLHSKELVTAIRKTTSYIQTAWPFWLKF